MGHRGVSTRAYISSEMVLEFELWVNSKIANMRIPEKLDLILVEKTFK